MDSFERITPSNIDAERAVLGSMLLDKEAVSKVLEVLSAESFYVPSHQVLFDIMKEIFFRNSPVDIVTVTDALQSKSVLDDIGGYVYLMDLAESVPTTANVEQYAKIVEEKHIRRELIKASNEIIKNAYSSSDEISVVLDGAEKGIFAISQKRSVQDLIHIKDTLVTNFNNINENYHHEGGKVDVLKAGVSTGISSLDEMISGLNPPDLLIIAARPAMGKMENVNNMIITPNGKIRMGDIKIGQKVCGSDGKVYEVTGVFPHGIKDSYRVNFDDNTYVDCGLEHLWEVTTRKDRKAGKDKFSVLSTEQLMRDIYLKDGRKNYALKIAAPIYFEEQEINVNPYVLGFYIGDGYNGKDSHSCLVSNTEIDIIEKFKSLLPENDNLTINEKDHRVKGNLYNRKPSELYVEIEKLGLNEKSSSEKFIPKQYIYNSIENRIELLRGLIDTDGFIPTKNRNQIEYSTTSHQLKEDILELVRSLGGKATYQEKQGAYTKNGEKIVTNKYYRLYLSLPESIIPVSSKKHLEKYNSKKRYHKKYITKIEYVEKAEMQCISVNSPDNLYITEGYNLTHNTAFVLNLATNVALKEKAPVAIFSLEMSRDQIAQRILSAEAGISSYHMKAGNISQETWTNIADTVGKLYNIPIYIDDSGSLSPMDMRAKVRRLKSQYKKLGVVIVDYLQLMEVPGSDANRVNEISKVTRALKRLAMEMQVPVIALSQLSRTVESRQNKRPQLSDLRESGCVTGDTLLIDSETGHRVTIKEMLKKQFTTISLDNDLKLNNHNVSNVFYSGKKTVYEITTRTGKSIKASANHPFMKITGWERLDNLKVGDRVAVARNIDLKNLYESDILWDEIISIQEIGVEDVYDATVNSVHNFVANDFIVHNSIEQDADIVMFIYRDEYYNPDSAKTKIAEIIIAKHRNGPTGTVELYFDADLTKFSGLERNA